MIFSKREEMQIKNIAKNGIISSGDLRKIVKRKKPALAKPLKGYKGASVLEIVDVYDTDTYRSVYTVKFKDVLYVLHCFKKKSKKGIATPKQDIKLIDERLKDAKSHYEAHYVKE